MIRLTQTGVTGPKEFDRESVKSEFKRKFAFHVPNFLSPSILKWFQSELASAKMVPGGEPGFYTELGLPTEHPLRSYFAFLMNDQYLFRALEEVSGLGPFSIFTGRVFRRRDLEAHHDSWHDDVTQGRTLGVSINLGEEPFLGGEFKLRRKDDEDCLFRFRNTNPGDAVFFKISPELGHMVSPLEGETERTVLAGWFRVAHPFTDDMFETSSSFHIGGSASVPQSFSLDSSVLVRNDDAGFRVYCGRTHCSFSLNSSARSVLDALVDCGSLSRAAEKLASTYNVDLGAMTTQVEKLAVELATRGVFSDGC